MRGAGDSEDVQYGRVTKRLRDAEGRPIGTANNNPLIDTREYSVQFLDGHTEAISANLIAQHLYSQIDNEGRQHTILLDDIIDHRKSKQAIDKTDAFVTMNNGVKRRRETTQGWHMLCQWKDGSTNWIALNMKHSYPVQVAEYAFANKIDDEPAFAWWVPHVIKKRDQVLAKLYPNTGKGHISMGYKFQNQLRKR
jgi:hypothetical protein